MEPTAVIVKLHRELYTQTGIEQAAAVFADFAHFRVDSQGDHYLVEVSEIDGNADGDVVAEFCNFALANSATAGRTGE